jgi:PAS domain S-box-containing protein
VPRQVFAKLLAASLLLLVYYAAGRLGLSLAFVNVSATAIWAPTGIAVASMLVWGYRVWPIILVGAFWVNVTTSGSVGASVAIAVGNTLEGLLCAKLVNRYANGRHAFEQAPDIVGFALLAAFSGTMVSATVGVTSLVLSGLAERSQYAAIWLTWWLGDVTGALIVAPALILWATHPRLGWSRQQLVEAVSLFMAVLLFCAGVFGGATFNSTQNYGLGFFVLPLVVWAALRFSQREVALLSLLLSTLAVVGTLRGFGPFAGRSPNQSLLLLQMFVAVVSITGLILAAVVNERRRLAQTLRESEERYRIVADTASDAMISIDEHSIITYANPAVETILGYRPPELLGRELTMLMPERLRPVHRASIAKYLATAVKHIPWRGAELPGLHKDGHEIAMEVSFAEHRKDGAHVFIGVIRDITDRRRVAELEQRAIRLEAENRAVLETARGKREFLSRMSHELRTPLNAVLGFAEVLLGGRVVPGSPDFERFLRHILDSGRDLLRLIDALLDLRAIEAGQLDLHPEAVDLQATVAEVVAIFARQAADKQIVLTHVTEPGLDGLMLDPVRLKQVLYNVLSNALKFTPQQGRVEVCARAENTQAICIEVGDTGPGIDASDLPGLFTEFSRPPWTMPGQPGGAGVSLALTRKLLEAQGGSIAVRSTPGQGSVFSIVLPRVALARRA